MRRLLAGLAAATLLAAFPTPASAHGVMASAPADCSFRIQSETEAYSPFYSPWLASRGINGGTEYLHDYIVVYSGYGGWPWEMCAFYIQFNEGQYTYYHTPGSYHTAMRVTICGGSPTQPGASNTNVLWTDTFYMGCGSGSSSADSWGSYFNGTYGGYRAVYVIAFA